MIEDKVGIKEYLGIKINYSNEKLLDKFSLDTLKDRYLWENETHAQEAFARASVFVSDDEVLIAVTIPVDRGRNNHLQVHHEG